MTWYYTADENAIIENHPEEFVDRDDEGRLVIDLDELPREEKLRSMLRAAEEAIEASDSYDLAEDATVEYAGD